MAVASTPTPGIYNTGSFHPDITVRDFASAITRLMPSGTAPLFVISSQFKTVTATNTEHGYFAKTMVFPELKLTANLGGTAADTILTVANADFVVPGMVFRAEESGETMIVNNILSSTEVVVTRGTSPEAIDVATDIVSLFQIGNAHEEGSLRPNALALNPVKMSNITQIFRNTFAITGTAAEVGVVAGDETVAENERDGAQFHAVDIETSLIFGRRSEGFRNGQPFRTMSGLIETISTLDYYPPSYSQPNVFEASSAGTSPSQLEDYIDPVFNQITDQSSGNRRVAYVGGTALRAINTMCFKNGNYQLVDGQTNWGLRFKSLTFTRGTVDLVEHPLFNTNPYWSKMMLVTDASTFNLAYLGGRKTQLRYFNKDGSVAQDYGIDAMGGTFTTELTNLVRNPPANAVITNLTTGLKDT